MVSGHRIDQVLRTRLIQVQRKTLFGIVLMHYPVTPRLTMGSIRWLTLATVNNPHVAYNLVFLVGHHHQTNPVPTGTSQSTCFHPFFRCANSLSVPTNCACKLAFHKQFQKDFLLHLTTSLSVTHMQMKLILSDTR
jgi:hypothetical protein